MLRPPTKPIGVTAEIVYLTRRVEELERTIVEFLSDQRRDAGELEEVVKPWPRS